MAQFKLAQNKWLSHIEVLSFGLLKVQYVSRICTNYKGIWVVSAISLRPN